MTGEDTFVKWLLEGDPAVRWQVQRDLLGEPEAIWQAERRRTLETGWVSELLARQRTDGEWPAGRWTASTWTLLLLVACGVPERHPSATAPVERLLGRFMPMGGEVDGAFLLQRVDLCHLGFWLGLGAYFVGEDPRLPALAEAVLSAQLDDGGWNCHMRNRPSTRHSSSRPSTCSRTCASPADAESSRSRRSKARRRERSSSCSSTGSIARTGPAR